MNMHIAPAEKARTFAAIADDVRYGIAPKRNAAIDAIEDLIAFLDETEPDSDLEPYLAGWDHDARDDRERDDDREASTGGGTHGGRLRSSEDDEDDGTAEPSLAPEGRLDYLTHDTTSRSGWRVGQGSQEHWAQGLRNDGEEDAGSEAEAVNEDGGDVNDEPQGAAWTEAGSLFGTLHGGHTDDSENSLGWPEQVDQIARMEVAAIWLVADGEGDYALPDGGAAEADLEPEVDEGIEDRPHDEIGAVA